MYARHHRLALAAAIALAVPVSVSAQGILGKVKNKAAEVAGKKTGDKAAEQAGVASSSGSPRYNDNLLEITPARVEQLLRGAAAEAEPARKAAQEEAATRQDYEAKKRQYESDVQGYEQRKKDYAAKKAALEAKNQKLSEQMTAYQQCMQGTQGYQQSQADAMAMANKAGAMSEAERQQMIKKLEDLQKRMQAAQQRGDNTTAMRLADSARAMMGMSTPTAQARAASGREMQKCGTPPAQDMQALTAEMQALGPEPQEPQPPVEPARNDSLVATLMARRDTIASRAAGLTVMQYGLMKERVAAYLTYGESPQKLGQYVFKPSELDALRAQKDKLTSYRSVFNNDALGWTYWHSAAESSGGMGLKRRRG